MSDTTDVLSDSFILDEVTTHGQIAVSLGLWGIHLSLAVHACSILISRGLRASPARMSQFALILLMLAIATTAWALLLVYNDFSLRSMSATSIPSDSTAQDLSNWNMVMNWLSQFNFAMCDFIVVWRAWVLWPLNRIVRIVLTATFTLAILCVIAGMIIQTLVTLGAIYTKDIIARRVLLMRFVPFIVTNVVATSLILYKAWIHRQEVRTAFKQSHGGEKTAVERVFVLFVETGVVYVACWIVYITSNWTRILFMQTTAGYQFVFVWQMVMDEITAMYPTVVIIMVSKLLSTNEIIRDGTTNRDGGAMAQDIARRREMKTSQELELSAMQFEAGRDGRSTQSSV